jgi:hypothetical protein
MRSLLLILASVAAAAQTVQQTYVKASNTDFNDRFGFSVAISGNTMVIGAPLEDSGATGVNGDPSNNVTPDSGAAYVYVRDGSTWTLQAYLKSSNPAALHQFGYSVAISGDTIVVGAPFENGGATGVNGDQNNVSAIESGAAYVFVRSGNTWTQQAYLKASNTGPADQFGASVAISGDTIVVGAPLEDSANPATPSDNSRFDSGAVYVFARTGTTWTPQGYLKASNPGVGDFFGVSVSVSNATLAVGASDEDSNGSAESNDSATDAGAAYVFTRSGSTWTQEAYVKASVVGAGDSFGASVAVSGNTLAVGAFGESSNATGINGNPNNNLAPFSGAAYVFLRTGTTWTQQAYVKPSNTQLFSGFGASVALSDQNLVVGAGSESTTANDSGAAYWFQRTGSQWTEKAFLKAAFPGVDDAYGFAVAASGGLAVSGAYFEDSAATGVGGNAQDNSVTDSGAAFVLSLGNARPARIGTYTSGVWAIDLNGNFLNENGPPDRNVLFSLGIVRQKFRLPVTGTGTACWTPRCISTAPG